MVLSNWCDTCPSACSLVNPYRCSIPAGQNVRRPSIVRINRSGADDRLLLAIAGAMI